MIKARIISIGDEILIGQITNTNSAWIAQQLNLAGITVTYMCTVSDEVIAIRSSLEESLRDTDFVFITGGLGPTKDDITKKIFADFFNAKLVVDKEVLSDVTGFFTKQGREITEINKQQALVPEGCFTIRNKNGTAPGMWMKKNNTVFISMPGVPYEMKGMMSDTILPKIIKENKLPSIYHKTVLTQGVGESMLAEMIEDWENKLAEKNIHLAYLPQPGMVRLRLSASGPEMEALQKNINDEIEKLQPLIGKYIFGYENFGEEPPSLEKIISQTLRSRKQTLSVAESCTGGYISSLFTAIPGASDIFAGGIVPYTNEAKHSMLQVEKKIFETVGAVSKECVEQLAKNALERFGSDYALSVSGIAGPTGGTPDKPVGTVWVAVANKETVHSVKFLFGDNRQRNIIMTAQSSLNLLRKFIG
jgi:nicotinamide-nucleotide amidase